MLWAYILLWTIPHEPVLILIDHRYVIVVDILVAVEPEAQAPRRSSRGWEIGEPYMLQIQAYLQRVFDSAET